MNPQKENNNFSKKPKKGRETANPRITRFFITHAHTGINYVSTQRQRHAHTHTGTHNLTTTQLRIKASRCHFDSSAANEFLHTVSHLLNRDHEEQRKGQGTIRHFLIPLQGATLGAETRGVAADSRRTDFSRKNDHFSTSRTAADLIIYFTIQPSNSDLQSSTVVPASGPHESPCRSSTATL